MGSNFFDPSRGVATATNFVGGIHTFAMLIAAVAPAAVYTGWVKKVSCLF